MNARETREYAKQNSREIVNYVLSNTISKAKEHFGFKSVDPIYTLLVSCGHQDIVPTSALIRRGITPDSNRPIRHRRGGGINKPVSIRSSKLDTSPLDNVEKALEAIITAYEFAKKAEEYEEENNKLKNIIACQKEEINKLQGKLDYQSSLQLRAQAVARGAVVIGGE